MGRRKNAGEQSDKGSGYMQCCRPLLGQRLPASAPPPLPNSYGTPQTQGISEPTERGAKILTNDEICDLTAARVSQFKHLREYVLFKQTDNQKNRKMALEMGSTHTVSPEARSKTLKK